MNRFRGMLMLVAAVLAMYRGWRFHGGHNALWAYGLGALALAMAAWHFTRPPLQ
ncbi:MAG TPA: hypothetical protein VKR52_13810 [Terracidiphilus sp.]|nr:hypothetical protein [Terracidiphilus sp.]